MKVEKVRHRERVFLHIVKIYSFRLKTSVKINFGIVVAVGKLNV